MGTRGLHSRDLWALLRSSTSTLKRSACMAVCVRPDRPSDLALATLLSSNPERPVNILCQPPAADLLRTISPSASIHEVPASPDLRPFARWALENDVHDLILGDTRVDAAIHALTTIDGGVTNAFVGAKATGLEMLPPRTLSLHTPLHQINEQVLDDTISDMLPPEVNAAHPSETARAAHDLGSNVSIDAVLRHGARKQHLVESLSDSSAQLLRAAILEASHWGYIVARRSVLAAAYHDGNAGRLIAVHAIARMALHVSGSEDQLTLDDEHIARLTADLLRLDSRTDQLMPLPKGRTATGMVVRPATGRFAKRLVQADRRTRRPRRRPRAQSFADAVRRNFTDCPDDLMILTREPDQESGALRSRRLRGNWSSVPLRTDTSGAGVYWDNRFVMATAPVSELDVREPAISPRRVMLAALETQQDMQPGLNDTELYVRQIRRADWEHITSSVSRVRSFQIPFQCIRALPAVFQKTPGGPGAGHLVASPHLGLSARPDLYFTAVRMPRYRCLPEDIDPGFAEEHFQQVKESDDTKSGDLSKTRRRKWQHEEAMVE